MKATFGWFVIALIWAAIGLTACDRECQQEKIVQVGGCDDHGRCGVVYESGRSGDARYPVVGQYVNACHAKQEGQE